MGDWRSSENFYIVTTDWSSMAVGSMVYWQDGQYGESLGLLLALTKTPLYHKCLVTDHGLRRLYG